MTPQTKSARSGKSIPSNKELNYCVIDSPVGKLLLVGDHKSLKRISFQDGTHSIQPHPVWIYNEKSFRDAIRQLREYFSGRLKKFTIKLAPEGTLFQQQVWKALKNIPYGKTVSYGDIAKAVGRPNASRAVGAANGQNPLSIIIPCHRVIGSTGKLVGYGGGLTIKEALLSLEHQCTSRKK